MRSTALALAASLASTGASTFEGHFEGTTDRTEGISSCQWYGLVIRLDVRPDGSIGGGMYGDKHMAALHGTVAPDGTVALTGSNASAGAVTITGKLSGDTLEGDSRSMNCHYHFVLKRG
jgi:hypothetical protein